MRKATISGFPEWLPEEKRIEDLVISKINEAFALHGFESIETRTIEPVSALLAKGETSKEIYLLSRLQNATESPNLNPINLDSPKQLGLHFDLTIPFARYISENAGYLKFPFRRTSVGKVFRGERPQSGRFREFTQADVDIVARAENGINADLVLPISSDIEVVRAVDWALRNLSELGLPKAKIHVNNRKILQGAYEYFGIDNIEETMRILDKLDKISADGVTNELSRIGMPIDIATKCLELASIQTDEWFDVENHPLITEIVDNSDLANAGMNELNELYLGVNRGFAKADSNIVIDFKITRGLDYYTGSVFETFLEGFESLGSISSGGRYDNLAGTLASTISGAIDKSNKGKVQYPGVGMSIGVTRLMSIILDNDFVQVPKNAGVKVLVALNSEDHNDKFRTDSVVLDLRAKGISAISSPKATKFGKQIDFAASRNIQYVWFIDPDTGENKVKDIISGEQHVTSVDDFSQKGV